MSTSIYSWIGSLGPEFPIAALLSACNRTTITNTWYLAGDRRKGPWVKILNRNLLNPE